MATEEEGGGAGEGEGKSESHVYVDARSYLFLEVEMHRPLIPKRPASVLAERCVPVAPVIDSVFKAAFATNGFRGYFILVVDRSA